MLSEASAGSPATVHIPAVAERSNASRRVNTVRFDDSDINASPLLKTCNGAIRVQRYSGKAYWPSTWKWRLL
jgi:hypothetical protein